MADDNRFGTRLRELREAAGMTQRELVEKVGITLDGLSKLERGERSPTWETAIAIATALGVSCEAFREASVADPSTRKPGRPRKPTTEPTVAPEAPEPAGSQESEQEGKKATRKKKGG